MLDIDYDERRFRQKVENALQTVRQILDSTRNPTYAADVHHSYEDKFTIAEFLVKSAVSSDVQALSAVGVSSAIWKTLNGWCKNKTVSLRFSAEETCKFVREESRDVESAEKRVTRGMGTSIQTKTVTTIKEYFWDFEAKYTLVAFCGVGSESHEQHQILSRSSKHQLKTTSKANPRHEHSVQPPLTVDISWLLRNLDAELNVHFRIRRDLETCRTPRRNTDVEQALQAHRALQYWISSVRRYFTNVFSVWTDHGHDMSAISAQGLFVPVLPLLDDMNSSDRLLDNQHQVPQPPATNPKSRSKSSTLSHNDFQAFSTEQRRSLSSKLEALHTLFPPGESGRVLSVCEARLLVCLLHLDDISRHLIDGVNYIEEMLRRQLLAAVGKAVNATDFAAYTRFHNRRLFRDGFQPRPFCYAVRRTGLHSPEGQVSIEEHWRDGVLSEPAHTVVRYAPPGATQDMQFRLNAAAAVTFGGDRYLHAWLRHSFSTQPAAEVVMAAQARQFSSFIVLIGTVASATEFEPKYGIIVQNKDEVVIPLMLETMPSAKEFRDAIESLSPEQRDFAKAFRSMQLASTLFAVCVIQIKPQLERLLNLPPESLTKEIKLTQDLTELFITYQIPSDMLSADGGEGGGGERGGGAAAAAERVAQVKGHVAAMQAMVEATKEEQLRQQALAATHRRAEVLAQLYDDESSDGDSDEGEGWCEKECEMECEEGCDEDGCDEDAVPSPRPSRRRRASPPAPSPRARKEGARARRVSRSRSRERDGDRDTRTVTAKKAVTETAETEPADAQGDGDVKAQADRPRPDSAATTGKDAAAAAAGGRAVPATVDYTKLPGEVNRQFEALDPDGAVRPTTIRAGETWRKRWVGSLLSRGAEEKVVGGEEQRGEKGRALELLDALTRGGALRVEEASLHVVLAATHGFDKALVDTVVVDGVNPIDKVERSTLIMASAVLQQAPHRLVAPLNLPRLQASHPALFAALPSAD